MIDSLAKKISSLQVKYPKRFVIAFLIITFLMIPGIFNLVGNVEPSLEKVLPQDIDEIESMNYLRGAFGVDMFYVLVYIENPEIDIRDNSYLLYIDELTQKFETQEYVLGVSSISSELQKVDNSTSLPTSVEYTQKILNDNPQLSAFYNSEYSFSIITLQTNVGSSAEAITDLMNNLEKDIENTEYKNPGTYTQITGFGAIDYATFSVIMSDFLMITFVSMGIVGLIVWITFGSLSRGLLPMIIVMNALVWTMGIVGYLGLTITVVSMVAAAMIMGLGIDFGIHQVHAFFNRRENENKNAKVAVTETLNELLRAMIGASLTTMAGFLALLFGVLPAMKNLGIILALGIFTTLIGAIFLLPVVLYLYDRNKTYTKKVN